VGPRALWTRWRRKIKKSNHRPRLGLNPSCPARRLVSILTELYRLISKNSSSSFSFSLCLFEASDFFLFLLMDPLDILVGLLGRGISPAPRPLQDNTTQRNTDTHPCPEQDPNVRAAEGSTCLRPRGH
jgi:hypothetical protein